jgi:chromate reductase
LPYNVLAVIGSLRAKSLHRSLFHAAVELAPAGLVITEYDGVAMLPLYNADHDGDVKPQPVQQLFDAVRGADALLFITPEYNYSIPGALKNVLDWASRGGPHAPMRQKPVAIMGGSPGPIGSMRMQHHLRQSLVFTDNPVLPQPEVGIPQLNQRFDNHGVMTDQSTRDLVAKQLAAFETWIGRFVPKK